MIAGGGDLMQKGARRLRPVEDSQEGGQAGSSSWSWGEFFCSNVIQSGRMGVITWYYRISKTVKIKPNHILQTRWPLSSRETLRKRLVEESPSPSPLVRSTTLSSIQRPEKSSIVMCYAFVHAQHFNYWIISLSLYWKGDGGEANVVVSKSGDQTKKTNSDKNQDV